jgi:hypothetical protein
LPPKKTAEYAPVRGNMAELQDRVLALLGDGYTVKQAMAKVDRSEKTYEYWRANHKGFAEKVDRLRARQRGVEAPPVGDFGEWREKYLGMKTFPHQWQWVDILEGREPRDLDPVMTYLPGRPQRVLINTPPFHAKTMTITIDYVVYRICQDPNVRIIIISESRDMARKMLRAIKERLTHPKYEKLQLDYGPAGGFKSAENSWTQDFIYIGGRDGVEKDPTVEALGVGSQIYGARANLIIMDDTVTLKTARTQGQRQKLIEYIDQDVSSRLDPQGKLLIVGTRVATGDVYRHLLKRKEGVWTYLAQPAVLEYADNEDEWRTLWPFLWNGPALASRRDEIEPATWNLVYQQQEVAEDAVFPEAAVVKCGYFGVPGLLSDSVRPGGMQGLYVVAGLDPAAAGYTAIVVLGVDKRTKCRYVLDVLNTKGLTPHRLREQIKSVTRKYHPNEWRIEKNGLQTMISQDREIRQFLQEQGIRVTEHQTTGHNKWSEDFGVATLAPLFTGALDSPPRPLIQYPTNGSHKGILAMIDQLITWEPEAKSICDIVMALWFAELGCRRILEQGNTQSHVKNKWLTRGQLDRRHAVNLDEALAQQDNGLIYV